MPDNLTVYSFIPRDHTASSYYRIQVAAQTAHDMGLPVRFQIDTDKEGITAEQRVKAFCEADVSVLYQPIGDGPLHNVKTMKSFLPSLQGETWKYPPTFILDTDDNLFRVDPHNPAFSTLGVRDPDTGKEIPKGFSISYINNGVRRMLWKDGAEAPDGSVPFDVERNKATIETYVQLINHADCVTATTPRCLEPVKQYATPRRTQVFPNLIRFKDYPQLDLVKDESQVKILFQGGANHYMDWLPLKDAVKSVTEKFPQIHWIMWGVDYPEVTEVVPPHRMTFMPWCAYPEYKLRRVMVGEDVSLAPLSDTPFNRCRSAIKWYEATVQKHPSATLAQATGPYQDEIEHDQTGLLFNTPQEFEEQLSRLVEDLSLRKTLGANAKDWLSENRDAFKEVPKQIRYYEELRAGMPREHPHMPINAWKAFEASMIAQQQAQEAAAKAA